MPKSPEQFYEQHRKDAERIDKAKSTYDKHLEEARQAGDLNQHPELWDEASAEYQTEVKQKIAEAVKAENYDIAEELIRGLRGHLNTIKKNKELEENPLEVQTSTDKIEGLPVVKETREEVLAMISGLGWKDAKNDLLGHLKNGDFHPGVLRELADMRSFDPERFDKEIEIAGNLWQQLSREVEDQVEYPKHYLTSTLNLKRLNPELFKDQYWNRMGDAQKETIWGRIMDEVMHAKNYPLQFLMMASGIKDLDPKRFEQQIGGSQEFISRIWPNIQEELERYKIGYPEFFVTYAAAANNIRPENQPEITMEEQTWKGVKRELEYNLDNRMLETFFSIANNASRLRVQRNKF